MKFEEALNQALDSISEKQGIKQFVTPETAKILSIMWDILLISEKKLDDFVYIDDNKNIRSFPVEKSLQKSSDEQDSNTKKSKKSANKKAGKKKGVTAEDGKEQEEITETGPETTETSS